ncbi:unnamed protein product [Rotaria sp. Silwood1]|nr:unnamed protein product [Rotaria sp. Silwood1]CAF3646319.1 unnamed protein product [Rotaria sp. Silwood1]CAF4878628.1 unnamed protein product [Rotaria sp. Silwood1]
MNGTEILVIDGRSLRKRRQATGGNTLGQNLNNLYSSGYSIIRDNVAPAISSVANQFSQNLNRYQQGFYQGINQLGQNYDQYKQNFYQGVSQIGPTWDQYKQNLYQGVSQIGPTWDQYKQNANQAFNQIGQGFNRFGQSLIPQYPYNNNNNNIAYNQNGYYPQQYPNPINYNYNVPPNMYRNYDGRPANPYAGNNFVHWRGTPGANAQYYSGNIGGQSYQNFGGQQRSNEGIAPNSGIYANQMSGRRRR